VTAGKPDEREPIDCLVVGGGPAGLTAAIYLARFHLKVRLIDAGESRALSIPLTRNHAGFPEGISGPDLLARMREQALLYGVELVNGVVKGLSIADNQQILVATDDDRITARAALLATGVVNHRPDMDATTHDAGLARGKLRYCPICDGYEVTDKRIAVLGQGERGAKEALFLRSYSSDVTLLVRDAKIALTVHDAEVLGAAGIRIVHGPPGAITLDESEICVVMPDETLRFDTLYPALGSTIRSELASGLGAECSDEGCLIVDAHQRTSITGLYAAGDVVLGLDQISHAMGEGGVAATTIRNDLDEQAPSWR
jgi:thioredoxin reductase (NADPH)